MSVWARKQAAWTEKTILLFSIVLCGLYLGENLRTDYIAVDQSERSRLRIQAKIIDNNLERQLVAVNNALVSLQQSFTTAHKSGDAAQWIAPHLTSLGGVMPGVRTFFVMNGDGLVIASNRAELVGRDLHDRQYFILAQQANDPTILHVSSPILTALGTYAINIERSLVDHKGHFIGLIGATLEPEFFATLLRSVNYSADTWSSIVHADGTLFLIEPEQSIPLGKSLTYPHSLFQKHMESGQTETILSGKALSQGHERIVARRTVQPQNLHMDQPLLVAVSRDVASLFAPWQAKLIHQSIVFVLLAGSSIILLWVHQRRQNRIAELLSIQEAELKRRDKQMHLFFDRQLMGMAIVSPQQGWLRVNDRLCELLGYGRHELATMTWADITHPDDLDVSNLLFKRLLSGEVESYAVEKRYLRKDGQVVYADVSVGCVRHPDGAVDYVLGVITDITARKMAEQIIALQSSRYASLLKTAVDGIHILDQNGDLVEASDSFWTMLGYDPEARCRLNIRDWHVGDGIDELMDQMTPFVGTSGRIETLCRRANGDIITVEKTFRWVDIDGTKYLYASFRDITERKIVEMRLREHDYILTESQRISHVGSWHMTLEGHLTWSDETYKIYQVTPGDFTPTPEKLLALIHSEDRPAMMQWIEACKGGHKSDILEFRIITPKGNERILSGNGELLRDSQSRPLCMIGIVFDITERRMAEQQLQISAVIFEADVGMMVTDSHGTILRVNRAFTAMTAFDQDDVVGKSPRILRSGRHDQAFYSDMWTTLATKGAWEGEIWNRRKTGEIYPQWLSITAVKAKTGPITHYVATLLDITLRKKAEEEIKHMAFYDPLTGLPNRRLCMDRLTQATASSRRTGCDVAIMFIDLDHFKELNDTFGHNAGDQLLKQVAQRLRDCVREDDTVARLGGDEFVIMLEDLSQNLDEAVEQTEGVGQKVLSALNAPFVFQEGQHCITPSIGIALFNGSDGSTDDLLNRADMAMYAAKAAGRNTMRLFGDEMLSRSDIPS